MEFLCPYVQKGEQCPYTGENGDVRSCFYSHNNPCPYGNHCPYVYDNTCQYDHSSNEISCHQVDQLWERTQHCLKENCAFSHDHPHLLTKPDCSVDDEFKTRFDWHNANIFKSDILYSHEHEMVEEWKDSHVNVDRVKQQSEIVQNANFVEFGIFNTIHQMIGVESPELNLEVINQQMAVHNFQVYNPDDPELMDYFLNAPY
jgi:hypothetical protein